MSHSLEFPQGEVVSQEKNAGQDVTAEKRERERLQELEWPLQAGWFEYRVNRLTDTEIEVLAQEVAERDPSDIRREGIRNGTLAIKRDAVITDLVDPEGSVAGSIERQWFRSEAMRQPLHPRFKEALQLVGNDESALAFEKLDTYFRESTKKH
jgi:hypothetical protein